MAINQLMMSSLVERYQLLPIRLSITAVTSDMATVPSPSTSAGTLVTVSVAVAAGEVAAGEVAGIATGDFHACHIDTIIGGRLCHYCKQQQCQ